MNDSGTADGASAGLPGFRCRRCGACCRRHGTVRISDAEAEDIAAFLKLDVREFADRYADLLPDRSALTLTERENGDCIFYDASAGCRIQPVKPAQCRNFPFFWRFPGWDDICEGGKDLKKSRARAMLPEENEKSRSIPSNMEK